MSHELDQLDHIATAADAGAQAVDSQGAPEAEALPMGPDYATQAAAGLDLFTGMLAGYAPETAQVFTPECKGRIIAAAVPVMEKYQFTFEKVPPEIVLMAVAGPPLYQAARMVAARMETDKRAAQAKAVQATPKPHASGIEKAAAAPMESAPAPERHPQEKLYS